MKKRLTFNQKLRKDVVRKMREELHRKVDNLSDEELLKHAHLHLSVTLRNLKLGKTS